MTKNMANADYITAEERYSRSLTWFKIKKFLYKHLMKIEAFIWGSMLFGALFASLILCSNI